MSRFVTDPTKISKAEISMVEKTRDGTSIQKIFINGEELLLEVSGSSYGFRHEKTQKGNPKCTLPLSIPWEFVETFIEVARKLGSASYSPVYETEGGESLVYVQVPMSSGGYVFAYIHDVDRKKVKPSDKTSPINVRAVIKVDSIYLSGNKPKIILSLIQAEVTDREITFVDLLD